MTGVQTCALPISEVGKLARAWVNYNAVEQVVRSSFNVSSVTWNNYTSYTVNFTTAFPNNNYVPMVSGANGLDATYRGTSIWIISGQDNYEPTASSCTVNFEYRTGGGSQASRYVGFAAFS